MNDITSEIVRQFEALAPYEIVRAGKLYQRKAALFDDTTDTIRFDYIGMRRPGVRFHDKLCISVSYQHGSDTYTIVMMTWDGATEETTVLHSGEGHHAEDFGDVARWAA